VADNGNIRRIVRPGIPLNPVTEADMKQTNNKLSLRLDALRIDSFTTGAAGAGPRGTVRANQEPTEVGAYAATRAGEATCAYNTCSCWTWYDASCPPDTVCIG
jgi:hypothetical protein